VIFTVTTGTNPSKAEGVNKPEKRQDHPHHQSNDVISGDWYLVGTEMAPTTV